MMTLEGQYFDGQRPIAVPASMNFDGREARLIAAEVSGQFVIDDLKVSPRTGQADRFIALPNKGHFKCADHVFLDSLPQESPSEGPVAWLEQRWHVAMAGVVMIACLLLAGYFYGLPAAAKALAARIPIQTEVTLGRHVVDWLDKKEWFKPTNLDLDAQKQIAKGFDKLRHDLTFQNYYQLKFRSSILGANAFAFPGGIIVITDEMIKAAETDEEVMSVLAHEIGHVEMRHTLRSILQNSVIGVIAVAVTSDAASLSVAVATVPALFAQTKYSREFESAADHYAFTLMKSKGQSPAAFASLMERLDKNHKGKSSFAFISTHPVTSQRIAQAQAAAKGKESE